MDKIDETLRVLEAPRLSTAHCRGTDGAPPGAMHAEDEGGSAPELTPAEHFEPPGAPGAAPATPATEAHTDRVAA
eukprot:8231190-Lingulodinium_polyedra.AAC.1